MAQDGHVAVLEENHNECYNEHVRDWVRSITPSAVKLMSQKRLQELQVNAVGQDAKSCEFFS